MNKLALILPIFALAACSEEPATDQAPAETVVAEPAAPSLPAPDADVLIAAFSKACSEAEAINVSACKRAGIGSTEVICEYGLGDDEYLRNQLTLTPSDGEWTVADPETVCAQGA